MNKTHGFSLLLLFILLQSCKNESPLTQNTNNNTGTTYRSDGTPKRTVAKDVRDSVYFWAQTAYLWYKALPTVEEFKPLNYSGPEQVIGAVRTFSDKAPTGANRDRWSFVMAKKDWDNVASGNSFDHGMFYRFALDGNLYVRQVFKNSSAGQAGIKRGWKVLKVGGLTPTNDQTFSAELGRILNNASVSFEFQQPDGTTKALTLTATDYKTDPIQAVNVFEREGKKIGYFCFTDFLGDNTANELNTVFNDFKAKGVTDLIIDLRYNGGGYVSLAQQLCNHLAPSAANGKVMFSYQYNDKLSAYTKATNFSLKNNINISKLVVITTKNSASASELLINSLKPHMEVKIVGANSHGKPVGFPVIPVMNYVVAPVAFKTVNSAGEADYYDGFTPDFPEVDDLTKAFGDPEERCLKTALSYISTGKVTTSASKAAKLAAIAEQSLINQNMPTGFEGMYVNFK